MSIFPRFLRSLFVLAFVVIPSIGLAEGIDRFIGKYAGHADYVTDGVAQKRDMSVAIEKTKAGFLLTWVSVSYKSDGRTKEKTYSIEFVPSSRENIYQSAMKSNLFGKAVPLDPLAGEPFVWARFEDDTFSVYSLFIDESGAYEVQEFHRTLIDGGLDLVFLRMRDGETEREIRTTLQRLD